MITGKLHPKVRFDFMKLFKCICLLMCSTLTFLNAQKLVNKESDSVYKGRANNLGDPVLPRHHGGGEFCLMAKGKAIRRG